MKFLAKLEEQRPFLKLYYDETITVVNINRVLDIRAAGLKELQDLVQSLRASSFITHFTHHSDEREVRDAFNAERQMVNLQNQLNPQTLAAQPVQQQQITRTRVQKQMQQLQEKLTLIEQMKGIIQQALPGNKSITHLDLARTFMQDDLVTSLAQMFVSNGNILYLDLSYNSLTETGGVALAVGLNGNNSLTHLDLSHNKLTAKSLEGLAASLASNTKLTYLNLGHNPQHTQILASSSVVHIVEHSRFVVYLNLDHMSLGPEGLNTIIASLYAYRSLKYLNLAANGLNIDCAETVARLLTSEDSALEYLDLSENPLTIEGLTIIAEALGVNNTLRHLDVRQVGAAGKDGGECIAKILMANTSIIVLNVQNNALDYIGAKLVAEGLRDNESLVQVNMAGNTLDEAGGLYVAKALGANNTLTTLDLENNNIQSVGVIYLAATLSTNHCLQYLNLANNGINDAGIEALATVLGFIKVLNLSNNQIIEGAGFLAANLEGDLPLTTLILDNNPLQLASVLELLSALKFNQALHTLGLSGTGMGDQGIEQGIPLLVENIGIARLYLARNNITIAGVTHLAELLRANVCLAELCLSGNRINEEGEAIIAEVLPSSSIITLTGLVDKSGMISIALSKNINLFRDNLRILSSDEMVLDGKSLYILIKKLQARNSSTAPELSYADVQDNTFYLRKISKLCKSFKDASFEDVDSARTEHKMGPASASEERFVQAFESIDILGDIDMSVDAIV